MARKDVDLVIRAKDQAASVVDTITKALNDFVTAQSQLDTRAKKTESSLGQLGAAMAELRKAVGTLDIGNKLSADLDKAAAALARIDKEATDTQQEVARLSREMERQEAVAGRYQQKLGGATQALARQREEVARARVEQANFARATEQAAQAQAKAAARQAALPGLIARQEQAVAKAAARYAELAREMSLVVEPGKALQRSFDASARSVAAQTATLNRLQVEYTEVSGQARVAGAAAALFGQQAENAATNLARQERALAKIGQNYTELSTKSKAVVQQQKQLESALSSVETVFAKQSQQLARAEDDYVDLARAAGQADTALEQLSRQSIGNLKTELDLQRRAMLEAKREYLGLTEASTQLATTIGRAGVPTREMAEAFAATKAEAAAAKQIYQQQRQTLELLGRAYRETGTDIASLQATQARFAAVQAQGQAGINQTVQALARQRAELGRISQENVRAANGAQRRAEAEARAADASRRNASATSSLADAYRRLYGDTRQSLSLTQRLRGEVLSLVSAYGGLFGVISLLQQTVQAYQTLEAAQARLNVANEGNIAQSANDLDFLRRTANRLGVDLGTLANEYSKFALATQGTNLQGANTRKIFLAVAEAARVNKTSNEQLSGVFVALTQIVSKGAVQMEELRQQLGDRLPGALQIMADGLKVTTGELIKMLENGEVTSDALIPFAEELERRFSGGLPDALQSVTAELGRLQNAAFQALLAFGNAGFIESFTELVRDLTELLQSADFAAFSERASAAFSVVIDAIRFLVQNFGLVIAAGTAFIGLKIAPFLITIATKFGEVAFAAGAMRAAIAATPAGFTLVGTAAAGATSRIGLLATAMRGLLSATGVGLLITAGSALFGYLSSQADLATEALTTHRALVDEVKNAYDLLGGSAENWRKGLEDLTVTEVKRNLDELNRALAESRRQFAAAMLNDGQTTFQNMFGLGSITGASQDYNAAISDIFEEYRAGRIDAKQLREEVDKINQQFDDGSSANARYASELDDATKRLEDMEQAVREAEAVLAVKTGTAEEAAAAMKELEGATEDVSDSFDDRANKAVENFRTSLEGLKEAVPDMNKEMTEFLETVSKIDVAFQAALKAARSMPDAIMRIAAEQEALRIANQGLIDAGNVFADSVASGSLVDRIIGVESSGNRFAKNPDSSATGLGQFIESTWLRMFKQYFPDRAAGMTDAMILALRTDAEISRNMVDLYMRENARFLQQAGVAVTDASLYLAHFLGPQGAKNILSAPAGTIANDVLGADQVSANQSILDGKTREEIIAWAQRKVGVSSEELAIQERIIENEQSQQEDRRREEERAAEERQKQAEATTQRLADGQFEIEQQGLLNAGRERQAAIEAAIREAKAENPNITQSEIDAIAEQTGRLFDLEQQQKNVNAEKEKAEEAERRVNELLQQRKALEEQLQFAKEDGDTALQEELRAKLSDVNTELQAAITNAQAMWQAVGGSEGAAAVEQLKAAALQAERFGQGAKTNYLEWDRVTDMIVNGGANAFDQFARAVANGENAIDAAKNAFLQFAADFLLQIAQMIIRQAIFNALQGAFGGTPFGSLIGLAHSGGIIGSKRAGSGNGSRRVSPALFAGAPRYHEGGIIGLRPGEVPILAKQGEEMLTEDDPFHSKNRGKLGLGGGPTELKARIVNAIDSPSFLAAALASEEGERVMMNWLRANSDAVSSTGG